MGYTADSGSMRKTVLYPLVFLLSFSLLKQVHATEDSKTVSIHVRKTAFSDHLVYEIDNKEVCASRYVVQKGDSIWKIFRKKGLWNRPDRSELLLLLKKINSSLPSVDLIYPGETILLPMKVTDLSKDPPGRGAQSVHGPPVSESMNVEFESYRVKPGDNLVRVAQSRYKIPKEDLYNEYLDLIKKINPTLKSFRAIYPGQIIKLPVYSAALLRGSCATSSSPPHAHPKVATKRDGGVRQLSDGLAEILIQMGERWIRSGEHFVPIKPHGLIHFNAESFPLIPLQNGTTLILDMSNKLPDKIARLIESNLPSYRIVHLTEKDDLRSALNKILTFLNYSEVFDKNKPLELRGSFVFKLTGDWILGLPDSSLLRDPRFILINFTDRPVPPIPAMIAKYLERIGVRIIVYPKSDDGYAGRIDEVEGKEAGPDKLSLVREILNLSETPYLSEAQIPLYSDHEADLSFSLRTDFKVNIHGQDAVVEVDGLQPEITSLLQERGFLHLSLVGEDEPLRVVARTLEFIGIRHSEGPQTFVVAKWDESRKITLTIPGILFSTPKGEAVFATSAILPFEISAYLSQEGYKTLALSTVFQP